jgi:hypothetical protein
MIDAWWNVDAMISSSPDAEERDGSAEQAQNSGDEPREA